MTTTGCSQLGLHGETELLEVVEKHILQRSVADVSEALEIVAVRTPAFNERCQQHQNFEYCVEFVVDHLRCVSELQPHATTMSQYTFTRQCRIYVILVYKIVFGLLCVTSNAFFIPRAQSQLRRHLYTLSINNGVLAQSCVPF